MTQTKSWTWRCPASPRAVTEHRTVVTEHRTARRVVLHPRGCPGSWNQPRRPD